MTKKTSKPSKPVASKTQQILCLLQRPNGASIPELTKATAWQAHSIRGFLAGPLKKKLGLSVTSSRAEGKDRHYRLAEAP